MGIDTPHNPGFIINVPEGRTYFVMMCFTTPFFIRTESGIENGIPGDFIIVKPGFPQYHGPVNVDNMSGGFRNDWLHISGNGIINLAEKYDVPFNHIIHTKERTFLTPYFLKIESERMYCKPYWKEHLDLILEEIFMLAGRYRQVRIESRNLTSMERGYKDKFSEAKTYIHENFEKSWTVKEMADILNLSTNRFTVLYGKFFSASPKEELIIKRIDEAKKLLLYTKSNIEEIAIACGFTNLYYFSFAFQKRTGFSPVSFRKSQ